MLLNVECSCREINLAVPEKSGLFRKTTSGTELWLDEFLIYLECINPCGVENE